MLRNINGTPSMLFKVKNDNIVGYKNYNNNTHCGVTYWNYPPYDNKIQQAVLDQDPQLKSIIEHDDGVVIIRDKVNREYQFKTIRYK